MNIKARHVPVKPKKLCVLAGGGGRFSLTSWNRPRRRIGYHLIRGKGKPSKSEGEGVVATFFFLILFFWHFKSPFWKNICILWSWNLQNLFELSFSFYIGKKPGEIPIFRTFITKFWNFWIFAYFSRKIAIFKFRHALWRHNYVTPWPIVLILVCMDSKNWCNKPLPLVRRVTKNSLVRLKKKTSLFPVGRAHFVSP